MDEKLKDGTFRRPKGHPVTPVLPILRWSRLVPSLFLSAPLRKIPLCIDSPSSFPPLPSFVHQGLISFGDCDLGSFSSFLYVVL